MEVFHLAISCVSNFRYETGPRTSERKEKASLFGCDKHLHSWLLRLCVLDLELIININFIILKSLACYFISYMQARNKILLSLLMHR